MRYTKFKQFMLLLGVLLQTALCFANGTHPADGIGHIIIKEAKVQGAPRGSSIDASINGHILSLTFSENLGQVQVEVTSAAGASVQYTSVLTPNGLQIYIPSAGNYIVTFTLPNGDEYYGEFTVTD